MELKALWLQRRVFYRQNIDEFSAGIPVISNARILSLLLLHVLACCNYALIVIG